MIKPDQLIGELPASKDTYQNFFKIAWPSALETLLVGLVSSVDTYMVSGMGTYAINAVGITNQPKFILLAMIFSLNVGITAVVARRKGQADQEGANHTLRVGIILSAFLSIFTAAIGFIYAKPILAIAGAEETYMADAVIYMRYLMFAIPFQALNLTINAAQRGCGKTKISMWTNIISNLVNITFDYLLINGIGVFPEWGIKGAAVATILGAMAAFLISLRTLLKKNGYLSLRNKTRWSVNHTVFDPIFKVSGSAFVEQVFMRIGFLAYASIVARLGSESYAAHLICMNILNLSFSFGDGLSIAASALVGQNMGAKRPDLSIIYGKTGQRLAFMVSTLVFLLFILGRTFLVSIFNDDPVIIALGANVMILAALGTHAQTSQVVLSGCLRGAGDTNFVAITSLISVAMIRPLLTWFLCYPIGFGLYGAWVALIVDQIFRLTFSMKRFSSGKWAKITL
jgi:putative MATE family efflux protein